MKKFLTILVFSSAAVWGMNSSCNEGDWDSLHSKRMSPLESQQDQKRMRPLYEDEEWMNKINILVSKFNELEEKKRDAYELVFQIQGNCRRVKSVPSQQYEQMCLLQQDIVQKLREEEPNIVSQISLLGQKYAENPHADTKPFLDLQNALRVLVKQIDTTDPSVDLRPIFDVSVKFCKDAEAVFDSSFPTLYAKDIRLDSVEYLVLNSCNIANLSPYIRTGSYISDLLHRNVTDPHVDDFCYYVNGLTCPNLRKLKIVEQKTPAKMERNINLNTVRFAGKLEMLDASDNNWNVRDLYDFVWTGKGAMTVEVLNLQGNRIKGVPKFLSRCSNLKVLNLNYNRGDDSRISEKCRTDIISFLEEEDESFRRNLPKLEKLHIVGLDLNRAANKMWNLPSNLKLIEMDAKWLECIPKDRIENITYSADENSVTVHLK